MPSAWNTFTVEFRGGLVSNISPLQQGVNLPGTATQLINFEASVEGGYKRVLGYSKFTEEYIPPYGEPLVQGSGQSGTSLDIANIFQTPLVGDSFTLSGVTGTYTISAVTFNSSAKTASLTITPALASSPADKAEVSFSNNSTLTSGVIYFRSKALVFRNTDYWEASADNSWTRVSVPSYGTVLVAGGSQTGTSLDVDGLTGTPQVGDTFSITGVELVYTITSAVTVSSGAATLTISPALDSSPADNAPITFLSTDRAGVTDKVRFARHDFTGTPTIVGVDGANKPFRYDGTTFTVFDDAPSDVDAAEFVVEFKQHLFYGKGNQLSFSSPFDDDGFLSANGAGVIALPHKITGLIVFRDQLVIFSRSKIHRLSGSSIADFTLSPITQDVGCTQEDTIQEVGGDIAFVSADGVRLLSGTERIGDFGLAVASRPIQTEAIDLLNNNSVFNSVVVRNKNQYRVFGYTAGGQDETSRGLIGTQFADQTAQGMAWTEVVGIKVYAADSVYSGAEGVERIVFTNSTGYAYEMEDGNTFDGSTIEASFTTPNFIFDDPRKRKSFYKITTYVDPQGSVAGTVSPRLDFDEPSVIQPATVSLSNTTTSVAVYGTATYGTAIFGGKLVSIFVNQIQGSGLSLSLQYNFSEPGLPPFSLDALTVEYMLHDRN